MDAMEQVVKAAMPIMQELMAAHKEGQHKDRVRPGCPSCVFGKAK